MGFLTDLFKKKEAAELRDPVFGSLSFDRGIWIFLPESSKVGFMVSVDALEAGPSEQQRAFFSRVRGALPEFERRARDFIALQVEPSVAVSRLSTYAVEIGDDETTGREELVLELSDEDALIIHRVSFRAGQPLDYGFDD